MSAFRPAQEQRWDIYAGFQSAMADAKAQAELRGWCGLGLLSLSTAGVFALLLAISRIPGAGAAFPWPVHFFEKGLVIHVIFAFVVWFLCILGALMTIGSHRIAAGGHSERKIGQAALWITYLSQPLILVPAFLDRGEASLNNYVPVIIDPLYYSGLAMLSVGFVIAIIRFIKVIPQRLGPLEPVGMSALSGALLLILAFACFILAGNALSGSPVDSVFNEHLFWGGGHILQFLNVALMLGGWYVLGGLALREPAMHPRLLSLALVLLLSSAAMGPLFYLIFEAFSFEQTTAFTRLQFALAPPCLLAATQILKTVFTVRSRSQLPWEQPAFLCLILSLVVFGVGSFFGLFVDGADTRTPAHYHGVIGGVNIVFIGLFLQFFMPLCGRPVLLTHSTRALIHMYAWGQILASSGLFLAGGYGAPRKTAGPEQDLEAMGAVIGMYVNGIGALVAVAGGIMFIWICSSALLRGK